MDDSTNFLRARTPEVVANHKMQTEKVGSMLDYELIHLCTAITEFVDGMHNNREDYPGFSDSEINAMVQDLLKSCLVIDQQELDRRIEKKKGELRQELQVPQQLQGYPFELAVHAQLNNIQGDLLAKAQLYLQMLDLNNRMIELSGAIGTESIDTVVAEHTEPI